MARSFLSIARARAASVQHKIETADGVKFTLLETNKVRLEEITDEGIARLAAAQKPTTKDGTIKATAPKGEEATEAGTKTQAVFAYTPANLAETYREYAGLEKPAARTQARNGAAVS